MSTKKSPTIRKVAWISLFPQVGVMLILFLFYNALGVGNPVIAFTVTYILLSVSLRTLIPRNHREGISLVGKKQYAAAIPQFEDSYRFFDKYDWVDKYRYITMLNSSAMSFQEMALCNIAFCYIQLENIEQAETYYLRALEEFPESGLATAGLQYIESFKTAK
ncbi:MAG: tol-pal system YbgF family protein [Saprospiraceae bacterium]